MRDEQLEAIINQKFLEEFAHGDCRRNKTLGLDCDPLDTNQLNGARGNVHRLRHDLQEFLNATFPNQDPIRLRSVCIRKMAPIQEKLESLEEKQSAYEQLASLHTASEASDLK